MSNKKTTLGVGLGRTVESQKVKAILQSTYGEFEGWEPGTQVPAVSRSVRKSLDDNNAACIGHPNSTSIIEFIRPS